MQKSYLLKKLMFIWVLVMLFSGLTLHAQNRNFLSFDGNDYVKYVDDATLDRMSGATSFTIEAWIFPKSGAELQKNDRILQQVFSFALVMWDGNNDGKVEDWYFRYYHNSAWHSVNTTGDATLTLNAWNHVAVICNATNNTIKLYVNGVDVTDGTYTAVTLSTRTNDHLYIGEAGDGTGYFYGNIDEIRLKDEAVSPSDLQAKITDNEYTTDSHTAALFHFNEGTGTTTMSEASGNDATLGGTTGDGAVPTWRTWRYEKGHSLPLDNRYVWNGTASATWSNGANWDPGIKPASTDNVIIPGNLSHFPSVDGTATTPASCNNLSVESGASLTIPVNKALTVHGDLSNAASASGLVIKSNDNGNGSLIVNGSTTGNATVQRYIAAYTSEKNGWHEISSPVNNMAISGSDFAPGTATPHLDDLYAWNENSNQWYNYKVAAHNITHFNNGKGYLAAYETTATKSFTGSLNTGSIDTSNLSHSSKGHGWHLLGNPYPSALTWGDGNWHLDHVNGTADVWDENKGNYTDVLSGGIIPSTNGFFVQVTSGSNSLTIPAADRVHNTQKNYKSTLSTQKETLKFKVTNDANHYYDECTLGFKADATKGCDNAFDSHKLFSIVSTAPSLWTVSNGEDFSTNYLPEATTAYDVPLHFKPGVSTVYHLTIKGADSFDNTGLVLEDLQTGKKIDLNHTDSYDFSATKDDDVNRFVLHINDVTAVPTVNETGGIQVFAYGSTLYLHGQDRLNGKVSVFNTLGQKVYEGLLNGAARQQIRINRKAGIYFVRLEENGHLFTQKVFIGQ